MVSSKKGLGWAEKVTLAWFLVDALTHLTMELSYVVLALGPTAARSDSPAGFLWREYARADKRWAVRDPTVISLELLTVFIIGPLCCAAAYGIYYRRPWRHAVQLIVSVSELYGGFMTFVPDMLEGSTNLELDDPVLFWIYLVFMNGLWVWIPAILVWESTAQITHACQVAKTEERPPSSRSSGSGRAVGAPAAPTLVWFNLVAVTLLLYMILVPLVLIGYADPPPAKP